jgi:hypothetical protein
LVAGLGVILGRYVWPTKPAIDIKDFTLAKSELARRDQECASLSARLGDLTTQHKDLNSQYKAGADLARRMVKITIGL